jgi:hypothetical protein
MVRSLDPHAARGLVSAPEFNLNNPCFGSGMRLATSQPRVPPEAGFPAGATEPDKRPHVLIRLQLQHQGAETRADRSPALSDEAIKTPCLA